MIKRFRHKGLQLLYEMDDPRKLKADHVAKNARILARLDQATEPSDMDLPGYRLHALKGTRTGQWSVSVSGNWRIVFRLEDGHAHAVDLVDYH